MVREITRGGGTVQEFAVAQFVRDGFAKAGLFAEDGPIVGVNANAADPHYEPSAEITSEIRSGDLVLLDMWAKLDQPGSAYYDITWTGFCGDQPTEEMLKVYGVVSGARDAAIARVKEAVAARQDLRGFEVDDAARGYHRQPRLWRLFCASHRPLDRRGSARQWREHG